MAYGKSKIENPEIAKLELMPPTAEQEKLLLHTMEQLKRVANHCVQTWLMYHSLRHTLLKMQCSAPVVPCPPELCSLWLRTSQALCPDVSSSTVLGVTNWLAQTITSQKSPKVNEKRWRRVLRCDESHWSFTGPLPIRLWSGNSKIVRGEGGVMVSARLDRFVEAGKRRATSHELRLALLRPKQSNRTAGHRAAYLAACEIADGKRHFAQSQIIRIGEKWFLCLTVDGLAPTEHAHRDANRILCIRPGRRDALRVHADLKAGGFGEEILDRIAKARAAIDERRKSWRKEHGDIPLPPTVAAQLSVKWRHQSSAMCDWLASRIVAALKQDTYGKVLWFDGDNRTAALAAAGKNGERDRRELFPFELLRRKAEKRLESIGIEVIGRANLRSVKRRIATSQKRKRRLASDEVKSGVPAVARGR